MLGGRVKTLHPKVHGGILFRRADAGDRQQTRNTHRAHRSRCRQSVSLRNHAAKPDLTPVDLMRTLILGAGDGPVSRQKFRKRRGGDRPGDYAASPSEIEAQGEVSLATRLELARKAFALTARYDGNIATELERLSAANGSTELSQRLCCPRGLHFAFRAGKNCATARIRTSAPLCTFLLGSAFRASRGAAIAGQGAFLQQSDGPGIGPGACRGIPAAAAVIVKHNILRRCRTGLAGGSLRESAGLRSHFRVRRRDGIQPSARRRDRRGSVEALRGVHRRARLRTGGAEKFAAKKNLRLLQLPRPNRWGGTPSGTQADFGRVLVQEQDRHELAESDLKVVTRRSPTREEIDAMAVRLESMQTREVERHRFRPRRADRRRRRGADDRVDSVKIAVLKAQLPLAGSVVASDAFFSVSRRRSKKGRKAGATAVIQPGGSVRDPDVIAAAMVPRHWLRCGISRHLNNTRIL